MTHKDQNSAVLENLHCKERQWNYKDQNSAVLENVRCKERQWIIKIKIQLCLKTFVANSKQWCYAQSWHLPGLSTRAVLHPLIGWMDGWMDGWTDGGCCGSGCWRQVKCSLGAGRGREWAGNWIVLPLPRMVRGETGGRDSSRGTSHTVHAAREIRRSSAQWTILLLDGGTSRWLYWFCFSQSARDYFFHVIVARDEAARTLWLLLWHECWCHWLKSFVAAVR